MPLHLWILYIAAAACNAVANYTRINEIPTEMIRHISSFLSPFQYPTLKQIDQLWRSTVDEVVEKEIERSWKNLKIMLGIHFKQWGGVQLDNSTLDKVAWCYVILPFDDGMKWIPASCGRGHRLTTNTAALVQVLLSSKLSFIVESVMDRAPKWKKRAWEDLYVEANRIVNNIFSDIAFRNKQFSHLHQNVDFIWQKMKILLMDEFYSHVDV